MLQPVKQALVGSIRDKTRRRGGGGGVQTRTPKFTCSKKLKQAVDIVVQAESFESFFFLSVAFENGLTVITLSNGGFGIGTCYKKLLCGSLGTCPSAEVNNYSQRKGTK